MICKNCDNFTEHSYNFEIRVGEEGEFGKNPICYKQVQVTTHFNLSMDK